MQTSATFIYTSASSTATVAMDILLMNICFQVFFFAPGIECMETYVRLVHCSFLSTSVGLLTHTVKYVCTHTGTHSSEMFKSWRSGREKKKERNLKGHGKNWAALQSQHNRWSVFVCVRASFSITCWFCGLRWSAVVYGRDFTVMTVWIMSKLSVANFDPAPCPDLGAHSLGS